VAAAGNSALGVHPDVAKAAACDNMAERAMERFGRIDGLIDNAALDGSLRGGRFIVISEESWETAMAVSVKGIWNCCNVAVPRMR
jgi:3-oxoacyl-[acyl-carrier protein] reductase